MVKGKQTRVCGQADSTFMLKVPPSKAGTLVQSLKEFFFLDSNGEAKFEGAVDEGSKATRITNLPPSLIFGIKRTQVIDVDSLPCSASLLRSLGGVAMFCCCTLAESATTALAMQYQFPASGKSGAIARSTLQHC